MTSTVKPPMELVAERVQYRVGHGGFHSTIVTPKGESNYEPFAYVYDIGARPKKNLAIDAVDRFIKRLNKLEVKRVNYVILSHIDEDHVNGFETLMVKLGAAKIAVGTVMLPWLSTAEKLAAKAHANHRGPGAVVMNLGGSDQQIVNYLASLGTEGVAFLLTGEANDPPEDQDVDAGGIWLKYVRPGQKLKRNLVLPWKLVAMRLTPPSGTVDAFAQALKTSSGLDPNNPTTHEELLTVHRRRIRAAMAKTASDKGFKGYGESLTNWSCISVFGSASVPATSHATPSAPVDDLEISCDHGWLHTGDLPLHIHKVWRDFNEAWKELSKAEVCVLLAPHHGSENGHTPLFYRRFKSRVAVFTTGWSSKSLPGKPIYSHRNRPCKAMADASTTTTVIELNNP
jgi:beta-lactamase superfamily II metal-dependent hydrolase